MRWLSIFLLILFIFIIAIFFPDYYRQIFPNLISFLFLISFIGLIVFLFVRLLSDPRISWQNLLLIALILVLLSYLFAYFFLKFPLKIGFNLDFESPDLNNLFGDFCLANFLQERRLYLSNGLWLLLFIAGGLMGWSIRALRGRGSFISLVASLLLVFCLWLFTVIFVPIFLNFHFDP